MSSRRDFLKTTGLLGFFAAGMGPRAFSSELLAIKKRSLRFAHLTDVHIEPELNAPAGLAKCLHHLQSQPDAPSFILSGGDSIFDALAQPRERVELQWGLWQNIFRQDNSLAIEYCIGNHDCWGLGQKRDPLYGKKYAMEKMRLSAPYRSFDREGWHFIILDSIQPKPDGSWYQCRLDEEQFAWLQKDLASTSPLHPVIIVSHAPIVSAAAVVTDHKMRPDLGYVLGPGSMHMDSERLLELFGRHPNIRLCLSGHIHLYEKVFYNGITFISNGAVSGNWWRGKRYQTDNGYALVNLYDDGSFDDEYISYGWN